MLGYKCIVKYLYVLFQDFICRFAVTVSYVNWLCVSVIMRGVLKSSLLVLKVIFYCFFTAGIYFSITLVNWYELLEIIMNTVKVVTSGCLKFCVIVISYQFHWQLMFSCPVLQMAKARSVAVKGKLLSFFFFSG